MWYKTLASPKESTALRQRKRRGPCGVSRRGTGPWSLNWGSRVLCFPLLPPLFLSLSCSGFPFFLFSGQIFQNRGFDLRWPITGVGCFIVIVWRAGSVETWDGCYQVRCRITYTPKKKTNNNKFMSFYQKQYLVPDLKVVHHFKNYHINTWSLKSNPIMIHIVNNFV